jgi:hypothetical protein
MSDSDGIITLNCLVLGDPPSKVFEIETEKTGTVSSLKNAVKKEKERTFQCVDASALQAYQVSVSENDFATKLEPFLDPANVPDANILSRPMVKLQTLFSSPKEEHIHVIIARPPEGECKWFFDFKSTDVLLPTRSSSPKAPFVYRRRRFG